MTCWDFSPGLRDGTFAGAIEIGGSETRGTLELARRQLRARPECVRAALRSLGIPRQSSGPWG